MTPQLKKVAIDAKATAGVAERLARHLPPGPYLKSLVNAIIVGKVGYASAVAASPRLSGNSISSQGALYSAIQVGLNRSARAITGKSLKDKIKTGDLLKLAGLPHYNLLVTKAVALESWKAIQLRSSPSLSTLISDPSHMDGQKNFRSATAGKSAQPGKIHLKTFAHEAAKLWNHSANLQSAKSISDTKMAAKALVNASPV